MKRIQLLTFVLPLAAALLALPLAAQEPVDAGRLAGPANAIGADLTYSSFGGDIDPWTQASVSLSRRTALGSLIGRVNLADRFDTEGVQLEADAYPRLPFGYAYLNVGHALSGVFPEWRFGGELFANLPSAWEASAGFRELRFEESSVTLWTGSVGKYAGNYWFSVRPYARALDGELSASASLTARRYFADGDNYLGARVGYGSTPSDRLTPDELERTDSWGASLQASRTLAPGLLGTASLGYDREELSAARTRNRLELSAGVRVSF